MMGEIDKLLKNIDVSTEYRLVNIGGKKLYIEGIKALEYIKKDNISLKLKSKSLNILGQDLTIKYLDRSSCVVEGRIILTEEK